MGLRWSTLLILLLSCMKLIQMSIRSGFALQTYMLGRGALRDFSDDPTKSTEGLLEAIQMAWIDEAR